MDGGGQDGGVEGGDGLVKDFVMHPFRMAHWETALREALNCVWAQEKGLGFLTARKVLAFPSLMQ